MGPERGEIPLFAQRSEGQAGDAIKIVQELIRDPKPPEVEVVMELLRDLDERGVYPREVIKSLERVLLG
jgi:hypothetical protein